MAQPKDASDTPDMAEDFFDGEYPDPKDLSPAQHELSEIMLKMKDDPTLMGIHMLGKDGIYRSLDADRNVVDAVACTPPLIKALLDRMPYDAETEKSFRGVDGTKTPKEQWYNPLPGILPPPLEEKHRERSEEVLEEYRRLYYERRKKIEDGTFIRSWETQGTGLGTRENAESGAGHHDVEGLKKEHKNIYTLTACADLCSHRAWGNHVLPGQLWTVCRLYETPKVSHIVTSSAISHE